MTARVTRRVLVTGGAGFLAGHLAAALRAEGDAETTGADLRPSPPGRWDASVDSADLLDAAVVERLLGDARPDEVYHLVGNVRGSDDALMRSNADSATVLLDAVRRRCPAATVVLVGSAAEYGVVPADAQPVDESWRGAPTSGYGRAKAAVTAIGFRAARDGMRVTIARPFNPVGRGIPPHLVVGAVVMRMRAALAGPGPRRVAIGRTDSVRDFVDAGDVGRGLIVVARRGVAGSVYNLCTGAGHTVQDVIDQLRDMAGGSIEFVPDDSLVRAGDVSRLVGSPAQAAALGWRPERSLHESLRDAWDGSLAGAAA